MGFLIDTNLWIAIERGKLSAADIHAITRQSPIYLSPINLGEIRFGIELMKDAKLKQRATAMLRRLRRKPLLRISGETAEVVGALAAKLASSGRGHDFRVQDLWLAAQAVQRKLTLLTANAKVCARPNVEHSLNYDAMPALFVGEIIQRGAFRQSQAARGVQHQCHTFGSIEQQ